MGLLNRIGAFFYERATPAVTETVGVGGAVSSGGYLNSNEASGDMVGFNRWRKTAEWKRNVGIVSAALRRFLELAGSPKWSVAPFDKSAESMKRTMRYPPGSSYVKRSRRIESVTEAGSSPAST